MHGGLRRTREDPWSRDSNYSWTRVNQGVLVRRYSCTFCVFLFYRMYDIADLHSFRWTNLYAINYSGTRVNQGFLAPSFSCIFCVLLFFSDVWHSSPFIADLTKAHLVEPVYTQCKYDLHGNVEGQQSKDLLLTKRLKNTTTDVYIWCNSNFLSLIYISAWRPTGQSPVVFL